MSAPINEDDLQQAVALFYDGENAPTITAKGTGVLAEDIIALAQANEITLCNNKALVELLMSIELGEQIPESLYSAIAQIIAFAYHLQGRQPDQGDPALR